MQNTETPKTETKGKPMSGCLPWVLLIVLVILFFRIAIPQMKSLYSFVWNGFLGLKPTAQLGVCLIIQSVILGLALARRK
jgi:hypothetical protein